MSAVGGRRDGFCLNGGASPPVRLGDPDVGRMGDPQAGLPLYTHTGEITGTARAKQSNEHQYSGKFILGGFEPTTSPLSTRTVRKPSPLGHGGCCVSGGSQVDWAGRRAPFDPDKGPLDPDTGHGMAWHGMNGMVWHGMA